jgi:hypothetical protein
MSTIITRNSANSGSVPSSLVQGELAINVTDGRLFYGSGSGNVVKEFTGSASGGTINTGSFVTTSSFNNYTGSNTSQFAGTASYATNALSASYAISASYEINYETSSSYADFAVSASHALNADNAISSSYALTASYVQNAQTASYVLQAVSASFATLAQTASYVQNAQTASYVLNAVSSSYATTALSASFASTASYILQAVSASFATLAQTANTASYVVTAQTASYVLQAVSASYATNTLSASYAQTASYVTLAQTASYVQTAQTASFVTASNVYGPYGSNSVISASYALNALSASYAVTASYAITSSYGLNPTISGSINNVDYIDFNTGSATPTWKSGRVFWDNTDGCLAVYNNEADITLQVGQENWTRARNNTGTTITNGTVVRLDGSQGDAPTVVRAQSLAVSGSVNLLNQILGVATHDIEDNSFGYITTQGLVRGLNTNAFNDGDTLFVGTGSSGILQNTPPRAPYEIIPVGVCVKASPGGSGIIYVAVQQPYDFGDLSSVLVSGSYSYGDFWTYVKSGSLGVWTHTNQLSGSYGVTGSWSATSFTGSLRGTASYASQALSSSYATTASYVLQAVSASFAQTASYVLNAVSASYATNSLSASFATTASFVQNAQTASYVLNAVSASYATNALSSSFTSTASYVNTLNQNVLITGSAAIGTSSLGPNENTLTLGARDTGNEGGQIGFNAPGGTYTSASFIDNWSNFARILRGTNVGSTGLVAQWNLHTLQMQLPAYTNASSFTGTATANLAVDSGGNIITVSTTGGSVFPYVGNAVITGSLTTTGIIYAQPNGGMYFQGGDDAALYDINVANTMGIYGMQTVTEGAIKLGSNGPVLHGSGSRLGIGTTTPTSASLTVNGNVWATSFTGSLLGTSTTASYVLNAVSASFATLAQTANTASYVITAQTASYVLQAVSASFATLAQTANTASYVITAQTASYVLQAVSASFATLAQTANTASYVVTAQTASYVQTAQTASYVLQAVSASFATLAQTANTASYVVTAQTASYVLQAVSASFATTASYSNTSTSASYALSASYAPSTSAFPYTGSAQITGSLGVTGSFTTQTWDGASYVNALSFTDVRRGIFDVMGGDSIDADARDLYDSAAVNSINWDARRLLDSAAVASIYWDLRSAYDTVASQSIAWDARLLKIDNGPASYTVNWGSGILRDTSAKNSVDWENRTTIDTGNKNSIDWQNRQLKNTSATEVLNWQSGVTITGAATVTGSLELTGSFKVQGAGNGFTGPFPAIEVDDVNFSRKLYDFNAGSSSIDFGNRALTTANGTPAISWNGTTGTYDTSLYQAQRIDSVTRGNLYGFNSLGGQILDESYFDATVSSDELVYLNTDGQWYQVDQTTDSSTKMLGIAKNVFSQTGSVLIEGDVVVSTGGGYPNVNGAGYGLPIYIRESGGTLMSTTIPTTGYVRLLGHCYYTPYAGASEWIMKFRPSHEWIEL